ncbi:hypothetical protein JK364_23775 [Streptomyces sp. 110]|uniref:Uncharacterized protein n=1 Tax=Streptomyces endocoffeicus TaxID=2898945 RepID=A0ABS1PSX6_9ACTN|nr:hypothetical protein [Streptomyces endocoffeicus]MBL1115394.1 hypothetical protein [Streptomyces endocoffeicus]
MTASTPAARIRAYLNAVPDTVNLGAEFAYGSQFRSASWPHDSYPLTREDLEQVLADANAHTEAPVFRHCLFPACLREYDIAAWMDGKTPARPSWSGKGWQQIRPTIDTGYVCPEHAPVIEEHPPAVGRAHRRGRRAHLRLRLELPGGALAPLRRRRMAEPPQPRDQRDRVTAEQELPGVDEYAGRLETAHRTSTWPGIPQHGDTAASGQRLQLENNHDHEGPRAHCDRDTRSPSTSRSVTGQPAHHHRTPIKFEDPVNSPCQDHKGPPVKWRFADQLAGRGVVL